MSETPPVANVTQPVTDDSIRVRQLTHYQFSWVAQEPGASGVFTLSYGSAVLIAVVAGALWDLTGLPGIVYLPFAVCAAVLASITLVMRAQRELT